MSAPTFVFALQLSDPARDHEMLEEVARTILGHVGYSPTAVTELVDLVRQAFVNGHGPCDVRFEAKAGELLVVVSPREGREWHTTRPLP